LITDLFIILTMMLLAAFFSGMEIAFVSSNKLRIKLDKNQGLKVSPIISVFTSHPLFYITSMLVGNSIALVVYGIYMAKVITPYIKQFTTHEFGIITIQIIISTLIILFTSEFLSKMLFRIFANRALNWFSPIVILFYVIFYPVTAFILLIIKLLMKNIPKAEPHLKLNNEVIFGRVDLDNLLSETQSDGTNEEVVDHEIKIFQNALDFSSVKLRECMVPRTEIVAAAVDESFDQLKQKLIETGLSKIVVYEDTIDSIIGYFHSSEFFQNPTDLRSHLIQPCIVPGTMSANKLLSLFIQEHKSMAVVVDEFGGTSGIITIEDILEQIVGEIEDEHDTNALIEKKISENEFLFSARLTIDYLNEKYHLNIPDADDYETLAGFILFNYSHFPQVGDVITLPHFKFTIKEVSDTRIEVVYLER